MRTIYPTVHQTKLISMQKYNKLCAFVTHWNVYRDAPFHEFIQRLLHSFVEVRWHVHYTHSYNKICIYNTATRMVTILPFLHGTAIEPLYTDYRILLTYALLHALFKPMCIMRNNDKMTIVYRTPQHLISKTTETSRYNVLCKRTC